jgi:demethylmenaquinone methyltransferase/2-methoxy-6-polyprenyl-1,4-benzoquinol methylase
MSAPASPPAAPDAAPDDPGDVVAAAAAGGREKRAYVRHIFSAIAPRYDLLNRALSFGIDRAWRRRALGALGWTRRPAGVYVDLCAGTLDVGAQLTRQRGFAGLVVGADFAVPMLRAGLGKGARRAGAGRRARRRARPGGRRRARPPARRPERRRRDRRVRDPQRRRPRRGPRRGAPRAAPGARFVVLEFTTPPNAVVRAGYHAYFHHVLPALGRLVSGHPTAYAYLPRSVAHFPREEALAERMRGPGSPRCAGSG